MGNSLKAPIVEFDLGDDPETRPPVAPGDGRPSQLLPVVRRHPETGVPTEGYLRWGLIPHNAPTRPRIRPIHARAETITDKDIFRDAYRRRRCVVPMNCFYVHDRQRKPHAFGVKDSPLFAVAGIWENWRDPATDEWERTFATVTVEANVLIATYNDRMPAILRREDYARWLGTEEDPRDVLRTYPAEFMVLVRPRNR